MERKDIVKMLVSLKQPIDLINVNQSLHAGIFVNIYKQILNFIYKSKGVE